MSYLDGLLWTMSLSANGLWLATWLIRRAGGDALRLGRMTLALLVLVVLLGAAQFRLGFTGALFSLDKALTGLTIACLLWCLTKLAEWLPAPWGTGPRRRRARPR